MRPTIAGLQLANTGLQSQISALRAKLAERSEELFKAATLATEQRERIKALEAKVWVAENLDSSVKKAVERSNELHERLAPGVDMEKAKSRFTAWVGAELDRRTKCRDEIPGMPAAIRGAHTSDLEMWNSDSFRRAEAIRLAVLVTLREGDTTRDITARWPGAV